MINFFKKLFAKKPKQPNTEPKRKIYGPDIFTHHKGNMIVLGPSYEIRFGIVYKIHKVVMLEEDPEIALDQLLDQLDQEKAILKYFKRTCEPGLIRSQKFKIRDLEQLCHQQFMQCPKPDLSKILPQNVKTND